MVAVTAVVAVTVVVVEVVVVAVVLVAAAAARSSPAVSRALCRMRWAGRAHAQPLWRRRRV